MNLMSQKLLLEEINTIFRKFVVLTAHWKAVKTPLNQSAFHFNCTHWPLYFTRWRCYVSTLIREGFLALEPKLPATSGWVSKRCACCFDVLLTSDVFIWKFYFWWLPSIFLWTFSKRKAPAATLCISTGTFHNTNSLWRLLTPDTLCEGAGIC